MQNEILAARVPAFPLAASNHGYFLKIDTFNKEIIIKRDGHANEIAVAVYDVIHLNF